MRYLLMFLLLMVFTKSRGAVVGKEITYTADSLTMKGYIAYHDSISGKRPGIIVVHEWWGNNEYSRKRADMLAGLGYVAFALDMYGNGKQADNPTDAGKYAGEVTGNPSAMKARFMAAMDLLKKNEHVDPNQIGAIGYCFGGGIVLAMAREGLDLKAVVQFPRKFSNTTSCRKGKCESKSSCLQRCR